jgi:hypothetical protein
MHGLLLVFVDLFVQIGNSHELPTNPSLHLQYPFIQLPFPEQSFGHLSQL